MRQVSLIYNALSLLFMSFYQKKSFLTQFLIKQKIKKIFFNENGGIKTYPHFHNLQEKHYKPPPQKLRE